MSDRGPETRGRGRRRSALGSVGLVVVGVVLSALGVGGVLVATQGDVPRALAALGIGSADEPGVRLADGRSGETAGGSTPRGAVPGGATGGTREVGAGTPGDPEVSPVRVATSGGSPASGQPAGTLPDGPGPDPGTMVDAGPVAVLASVRGHLEAGGAARLGQALGELDQAERERRMTGDEASAWRMAIRARLERVELGELP